MDNVKLGYAVKNTFLHFFESEDNASPPTRQRCQSLPPDNILRQHITTLSVNFDKFKEASVCTLSSQCGTDIKATEMNEVPTIEQDPPLQQGDGVQTYSPGSSSGDGFQNGSQLTFNQSGFHMGVFGQKERNDLQSLRALDLDDTREDDMPANNPHGAYPTGTWAEQASAMHQGLGVNTAAKNVMMYSIPLQVTRNQVIDMINEHGFAGSYDSLEMPRAKGKEKTTYESGVRSNNMGYAFISFKTAQFATKFLTTFQDFVFPDCNQQKMTGTKLAHVQGYNENVERRPRRARRGKH